MCPSSREETYPAAGANKEAAILGTAPCGGNGDDGDRVDEEPDKADAGIQHILRHFQTLDDSHVGMNGDERDEAARGQIPQRHKESLREARRGTDNDLIMLQPHNVQKESRGLVHVGQQQVENQYKELIRRVHPPEFSPALFGVAFLLFVHRGRIWLLRHLAVFGEDAIDAERKVDGMLKAAAAPLRVLFLDSRGIFDEEMPRREFVAEVEEEDSGGGEREESEAGDGNKPLV